MNVTKIILTRCQIFHLKCTRPPSWIWGREEKSEERKEGKEKGDRRGGRRREGEGGMEGREGCFLVLGEIDAPGHNCMTIAMSKPVAWYDIYSFIVFCSHRATGYEHKK